MIAILLTMALVKDVFQTNAGSAQEQAIERCRADLVQKVNDEVINFTVMTTSRRGGYTTVSGTVSFLKRPSSRPGELSPAHVQRIDSTFRCRLHGRGSPRVTISPSPE